MSTAVELAEALQQTASALGQPRVVVLLDPVLRQVVDDNSWAALQEQAIALPAPTPVPLRHRELDPSAWPQLLELDTRRGSDSLILQTLAAMALLDWQEDAQARGSGHRIGGWLWGADQSVAELGRHLSTVMLQPHPQGGQALLRLHDPAAFEQIWDIADPAQQAALLGPLAAWTYLDRWGCLQTRLPPCEAFRLEPFLPMQWQQLDVIGPLNRAWRQRMLEGNPPDPESLRQAGRSLTHAIHAGFTHSRDLLAWAEHALRVHPEFYRHPGVAPLLQQAPGAGLARLMAEVSDDQWQQIARQCRDERPSLTEPWRHQG